MKGLLYNYILQSRAYLLGGLVMFTAATAGYPLVCCTSPDSAPVFSFFVMLMMVVAAAIIAEPLSRDIEKNAKSRFLNYALSGMTRRRFLMTELVKNLITLAFGAALALMFFGVIYLVDSDIYTARDIGTVMTMVLFVTAMQWFLLPITIKLKSAEKAGALFGAVIGFAVILPLTISLAANPSWAAEFLNDNINTILLALVGVAAAMYIIGGIVLKKTLERGDLC